MPIQLRDFLRVVILIVGCPIISGCVSWLQPSPANFQLTTRDVVKRHSPEDLLKDEEYLFKTLEDVHPNLYAYASKARIDFFRRALDREISTPMTRREFYFRVAPIIAQLGDGHTQMNFPSEEYDDLWGQQGRPGFPFSVYCDSLNRIMIGRDYTGDTTFHRGDRIVSINGFNADSLAADFLRVFTGERLVFRQQRLIGWMRACIFYHNILPPYELVVQQRGCVIQTRRRVNGVTRQWVGRMDSLRLKRNTALPPFQFIRLQDNIGYIDFRSMGNPDKFTEFLETTFTGIRSNPISGLIIDLRNNGGGNASLGDDLLSYLTDSSYRVAARIERKSSAQLKAQARTMIPGWLRWFPVTWFNSDARRFFGAADGDMVVDTLTAAPPPENDLRYHGRTCILIGPRTFSAAMMLANVASDYKLATLIGEETGGGPTAYGDIYSFRLPNTKLEAGVSTTYYVRANGNESDRRGVRPDIESIPNENDMRSGTDSVLERARLWLKTGV